MLGKITEFIKAETRTESIVGELTLGGASRKMGGVDLY